MVDEQLWEAEIGDVQGTSPLNFHSFMNDFPQHSPEV